MQRIPSTFGEHLTLLWRADARLHDRFQKIQSRFADDPAYFSRWLQRQETPTKRHQYCVDRLLRLTAIAPHRMNEWAFCALWIFMCQDMFSAEFFFKHIAQQCCPFLLVLTVAECEAIQQAAQPEISEAERAVPMYIGRGL